MAEFIERDLLIKRMKGFCGANCGGRTSDDPFCHSCAMNDAINMTEDQTAADVRSVIHGQWIGESDGYADGFPVYETWCCSNCDFPIDDQEKEDFDFCPNCGADMRAE